MAIKALLADPLTLKDNPDLMNKAIRWLMMKRQGGGCGILNRLHLSSMQC
jgi:hypothetical protein